MHGGNKSGDVEFACKASNIPNDQMLGGRRHWPDFGGHDCQSIGKELTLRFCPLPTVQSNYVADRVSRDTDLSPRECLMSSGNIGQPAET
jgi:hypothetical protein